MSFDFTQGDPRLMLDENGSDIVIKGGQPVMDQGLENAALISLYTTSDWWGNAVMSSSDQRVGSDFEQTARRPITISALQSIRAAAKRALKWLIDKGIALSTDVVVFNPTADHLQIAVLITPPSKDEFVLRATKYGSNWIAQRDYPANTRIS